MRSLRLAPAALALLSCVLVLAVAPAQAAAAAEPAPHASVALTSAAEQFERLHQELNLRVTEMMSSPADTASQESTFASPVQPDFRQQYRKEGSMALNRAAARVRRLLPAIAPILRQEGVPEEFAAIVLVESGGLPAALSSAGARGLWQLMPATARRYGLVVSTVQDDRLDLEKSTRAAARYLRDLHAQFGDWRLAFAAYNAGEQTLVRALARASQMRQVQQRQLATGVTDSDFASASMYLPAETRAYVPAVVSAVQLLKAGRWEHPGKALVVFAEARF